MISGSSAFAKTSNRTLFLGSGSCMVFTNFFPFLYIVLVF